MHPTIAQRATILRERLLQRFIERQPFYVRDSRGKTHYGIISALELEDGSGNSFNVRMGQETFHLYAWDGK